MKNNLYITIGMDEMFRVIQEIDTRRKIIYYFLSIDEYKILNNSILVMTDKIICNELEALYDDIYYDRRVLDQVESLINTFKLENIILSKSVSCKLNYSMQYLNKYFGFKNITVLDDYCDKKNSNNDCSAKNIKYMIYEYPECFYNSASLNIMNDILNLITLLFEDLKIIVLFKKRYNREKACSMLKNKRVNCVYINSFETYLYLVKNSYFIITDDVQSVKTADKLGSDIVLTVDKTRNQILDDFKDVFRLKVLNAAAAC